MSNPHQEKFVTKMLLGFAFTTAGILLIFYIMFEGNRKEDWYLWGIVASVLINTGLFLLVSAFVHKVKSDLIKRQKQRDLQKSVKKDTSAV